MKFASKLLRLREEKHMTQQELADAIGLSKRAIAAYESEGTIPRRSTMRKLSQLFLVSYDYLMDEKIDDPSYGLEKMPYVEQAEQAFGAVGAVEMNRLLEDNRRLFAGGDLDESAKDLFYQAITKAYIQCKLEARQKYGHSPEDSGDAPENRL